MGVIFGILAALCWGLGDFFITLLTRKVGNERSLGWTQIASLILWLAMLAKTGVVAFTPATLATVIAAGVLHVVGLKLTYRAFEVGTLSIVSPLASGFAIVTAVIALIAGHQGAAFALGGAALLVFGIGMATSGDLSGEKSIKGVPEALGSALAFGGMFYLFDSIVGHVGYVAPLVILKTMASLTFCLPYRKTVFSGFDLKPATIGLILAVSGMDTGAWLFFINGIQSKLDVAIVTAVSSLFSVVTVVLAGIFLKERLRPAQWAGVAVILTGITIVSTH